MYYANIFKDTNGRVWCESVHESYEDALEDVILTDGHSGNRYLCTLHGDEKGKFTFGEAARSAYLEAMEADKQLRRSNDLWFASTRL